MVLNPPRQTRKSHGVDGMGLRHVSVDSILDAVNEIVGVLAVEFDVVFLAEIVNSVRDLRTGVGSLLGGQKQTHGCASDGTA